MNTAIRKLTCIEIQRDDTRLARIFFNRPEQYNAMSTLLMKEFISILEELVADEFLCLLILEGRGKAFMSGADIKEYEKFSAADFLDFQQQSARIYELIETAPFPVIAAINGYAVGGGWEIALACDIRIAKDTAKMGLPEAKLGLIPGGGGTQRLTQLAGLSVAKEMLLLGRLYNASEMYNRHLITEVIVADNWEERKQDLIDELLKIPKQSHRKLKELTSPHLSNVRFSDRLNMESASVNELFSSPVAAEMIKSFTQKK
ncbi:enoyl-CoA hydratase/isomerase family protein [Flavihumibacter sp. UBA7668]|uniref:enoyl-CoA hydratase/isomerase family protein n=1 Tax=Flavihumibacter sp. UBA7668 TaxID=1946542 RepID=UPI0025C2F968|nr:enoyl-CoA hydratase/isomerase family protein [Flavihumibacter sp. UBA7668]